MDKPLEPVPSRPLPRPSRPPLHRRISDDLRSRISSGEFAVGAAVPSESDLMASFGVSRGTVRQALATLRAGGSIVGSRGAPPVVRAPRLSQPFDELLSFSAWVRSLGRQPGGRVIEFGFRRADETLARVLDIRPGDPTYRLIRVRLVDGEPLMIERTSFPWEIGGRVANVDLEHGSIYAELARLGITFDTARQEIDAVAASRRDALLLEVPVRTPLLRVRRRSLSPAGQPLEWSDDRYLSERVSLTIDNTAGGAALVRRLASGGR